jgi:SAM-dependent methyltransferase
VTDQAERYDRLAEGYAEWWAPVLAPAVSRLLDRAEGWLVDGARVLDIGTGTGQLAIGALRRSTGISVVGVDASAEMRAVADARARGELGHDVDRLRTEVAFADELPFADASFDVALSSFVFQLVPNRARALREAHRVVRPGGVLAYVTWLRSERPFRPDEILDEVLDEFGVGARQPDPRPGDLPSVERAAGELRRAGFSGVAAEADTLEHAFTASHYLAFVTEFDEESLFAELDRDVREGIITALRRRLARLSASELTLRLPIIFASGRRSA